MQHESGIVLSIEKLQSGDILELLKFVWVASKEKTQQAFKNAGLIVANEAKLVEIANLHVEGLDIQGINTGKGKIIAFNARKIAEKIPLTKLEVRRAFKHSDPEELSHLQNRLNHA